MHFDEVSDVYQQARPPYPAALWHDVLATGLVAKGRRALDLGAGTGEATGMLLAHGMDVMAVEPGPRMAGLLARRFPAAELRRVRAEDLQLDTASFDLAVAATSIHWMNLDVVLPLVHHSLTQDGRLLEWRNVFGDPAAPLTPFRRELDRIVGRRGTIRVGEPENADATAAKIAATRFFSVESIRHYRWSLELATDQIRDLFSTFSDWTSREVCEIAAIAQALGGTIVENYTSWLMICTPVKIGQTGGRQLAGETNTPPYPPGANVALWQRGLTDAGRTLSEDSNQAFRPHSRTAVGTFAEIRGTVNSETGRSKHACPQAQPSVAGGDDVSRR